MILNGDPSRTRTCNPLLRRQVLYPVELWSRWTPLKSREQIGQAQCVHVSFLLVAKLSP